jgi:hypothetical protein
MSALLLGGRSIHRHPVSAGCSTNAGDMAEEELKVIEDTDMDSLFILPLSIIPLETPALKSARLIKNSQLQSVIEIFHDKRTGSGQIDVEDLPQMMNWKQGQIHPDLNILRRLALLPSYDVYSLRVSLRAQNIAVNDQKNLRLSEDKMKQLTDYMVMFTRPLMQMIYSDDNVQVGSYDDLMRLFRDPDISKARERLEKLAETLNVSIMDVPRFLEDYADIFMSLSFYRQCLDRLGPYLSACLESMSPIRKHFQLMQDPSLMRTCTIIEESINQLTSSISSRLDSFEKRSNQMWNNISQEEFQAVKTMIERYHVTIGGALCGLTVKMNAFARHFPHSNAGGPVKRADFIMTEMTLGFDLIRAIERRFQNPDE